MNRREALAALTAIPAIAGISKADLKPEDVIVIEVPGPLSEEVHRRIKDTARMAFPNNKIMVMGDGLKMKVVHHAP